MPARRRTPSTQHSAARHSGWGRAYRDGTLVCARVHVTIGHDERLGLTRRERRDVRARFQERIDGSLRSELIALLRRRGAAARRIADTLDTIELVLDDVDGAPHRIVGQLQPPQARHGRLRDIEFGLHEQEPPR
jgi:hypothetical protein